MSNIGRRPIDIGSVNVEIKGQEIHYKGAQATGVYALPEYLKAELDGKMLKIAPSDAVSTREFGRKYKGFWGMHAALLANQIHGAGVGFQKSIEINGLGYKAVVSGNKLVLTLGYSHKIDVPMLDGVSLDIDKTGKKLTFKSASKALVGEMCDRIRSLRPPEPYKGTGVKLADERIIRKAGKAKASAGA